MKLMMWMALAKRLFTAINRTVSVIFMAVNPERCVRPSCCISSGSPGAAQTNLASALGWKEATADGRTQCPIGNSPMGRHLARVLLLSLTPICCWVWGWCCGKANALITLAVLVAARNTLIDQPWTIMSIGLRE